MVANNLKLISKRISNILYHSIGLKKLNPNKNKKGKKEKENENHLKKKGIKSLIHITFPLNIYVNILLLLSIISSINSDRGLISNANFITLKFNKIGPVQFIGSNYNSQNLPTKVYVDDVEQDSSIISTRKVTITNITQVVKIEWQNIFSYCKELFSGITSVVEIDLSGFDSSRTIDTTYMFGYCQNLTSINFNGFSTSLVTNMEGMFRGAYNLAKVDLSNFNTAQVKNMAFLFMDCTKLVKLDISNFNTAAVTTMQRMFSGCRFQTLNLSNFNTRKVTRMDDMFSFCGSLVSLVISSFETPLVTNFAYMFGHCYKLKSIDVSKFTTPQTTSLVGMFLNCLVLEHLDFSNFRTNKVLYMNDFLNGCNKLTELNFDSFVTSNVANMAAMFKNCIALTSLNLTSFTANRVTTINQMFANCQLLSYVLLPNFKTSQVTDMSYVFYNCQSLTSLNLLSFITSNVVTMNNMFFSCYSLTTIDLPNFDTTKVTDMQSMFEQCKGLTYINISNFYPNVCKYYSKMFYGCTNLLYVNFYNYVEKPTTVYNDFIKYAHSDIKLCIHVTKEARIYKSYTVKLLEECLIPDPVPTEISAIIETTTKIKLTTENIITMDTTNEIKSPTENVIDTIKEPLGDNEKDTKIDSTNESKTETETEKITSINSSSESSISTEKVIVVDTKDTTQTNSKESEKVTLINSSNESQEEANKNNEKEQTTDITEAISHVNQNSNENSNPNNNNNDISIYTSSDISASKRDSIQINPHLVNINNMHELDISIHDYNIINDIFLFQGYNNTQIYNIITDFFLQDFLGVNGQKIYIKGENGFIFEITTSLDEIEILTQKGKNNYNTSVIDLGQCNNLLKNEYFPNNNDNIPFIILKYEKVTNISFEKNIQFEVYEPFNKTKLDLSICQNVSIDVYIPSQLSDKTQKLIENLEKLGYDVFNLNSPFYTDFCTKYTTEEGTDITIEDRKKYIYEAIMNEINCQENCEFSSYDSDKRYLECKCKVEEEINTVDYKQFDLKKFYHAFYDVLKYSNYKVIFCYKLVFTFDNFNYNKGCWIIFILFLLYLTQLGIYLKKKISPLKLHIARYHFKKILPKKNKQDINIENPSEKNNNLITEKINITSNFLFPPKRQTISETRNRYEGKNSDTNILSLKSSENFDQNNEDIKKTKKKFSKFAKKSTKTEIKFVESDIIEDKSTLNKNKCLDNFELNNLEYEEALILDKRNFVKIYWSVLKREHTIIFTFFFHNDFNLYYVKFARFIFLLATDMAMNVFFFSDETMNKLYLSYGKYDFVQQIPQIIYSKLVSNIIEVFLCYLSLTDKHYYEIKALSKSDKIKIFSVIKCARIKLIIFFVVTFLIFLFYWYLITAFCAVYENTQITYIKDCLLSMVLGFFTPFIIYFFPSLLRIISLRCKCCDLKFMYKLSEMIPIF